MRTWLWWCLIILGVPLSAQTSVSLVSTADSAPVGTNVVWRAEAVTIDDFGAEWPVSGTMWYRYRVRRFGEDFQMLRDFGPFTDMGWAPPSEGTYEMEVTARNLDTGEVTTQTRLLQSAPLAIGGPVVAATEHPLVFVYSAPPCGRGSRMRVEYQGLDGQTQATPYQSCSGDLSMNFYLAGLQPGVQYQARHVIDGGTSFDAGPNVPFTAGALPASFAPYTVLQPPPDGSGGILLQSPLFQPTLATDLNGNIVWYYQSDISFLTRPEGNGRFLGITEDLNSEISHQVIREFDLAGRPLLETNAARINEQLAALGKRLISGFHHELRRLPNGNLLVLADAEQILTDVQGPGPVDVIGDMILVLDKDMQVVWTWDAFDYLDTSRMAPLKEVCQRPNSLGGCPPFWLADRANDWLHGNALQLTPDGNILYSARHQDWVIKIDYQNGFGSGNILWRLGKDGDFTFNSTDPYPWFSHQHDANIFVADQPLMAVFDNGNTRYSKDRSSHSRGQVLRLDEENRSATLAVNADLGVYSQALGSAQVLPNRRFHFDAGIIQVPGGTASRSIETDLAGNILYSIQVNTPVYRSFRMQDLYTP